MENGAEHRELRSVLRPRPTVQNMSRIQYVLQQLNPHWMYHAFHYYCWVFRRKQTRLWVLKARVYASFGPEICLYAPIFCFFWGG